MATHFGIAFAELVPFTWMLLWWLGTPIAWVMQLVRLLLFVFVLLPFFLPPTWRYACSETVHKGVRYGPSVRHAVDIYVPDSAAQRPLCPVVVFVSGGAWIIGYRMWGFLLGLALQRRGVLCVSVDYRNFPQSRIPEMVDDLGEACAWVKQNIAEYGGDPMNISLVGQSAGAHLSAMLLLRLLGLGGSSTAGRDESPSTVTARAATNTTANTAANHAAPPPAILRGFPRRWIGISGPYDMTRLVPALKKRGLNSDLMEHLSGGDLDACSPLHLLQKGAADAKARADCGVDTCCIPPSTLQARWPPLALFHGTADKTVDWRHSADFAAALKAAGAPDVVEEFFADKSHTDPILEDPLTSGHDPLLEAVLGLVFERNPRRSESHSLQERLRFAILSPVLRLARWVNPF